MNKSKGGVDIFETVGMCHRLKVAINSPEKRWIEIKECKIFRSIYVSLTNAPRTPALVLG